MGVPKFFRYISERYPCLSQLILECEIPEFDNLYLDMNGIIHNCSHPNDYDPHFRITEEKIFKDIFSYIETLFRIIKPKKLFFMAVDGVAPRAKMNQQRGRRFRSAKETEDRDSEVMRKGGQLPDTQKFDSNCITPGTSFMAKLQAQLKFFVANKVSTDKMWQKVKIILSGHECPGEGEHKIMDYIRYMRSQSDYDPNTRHCLYGLDADLIMLGLCTHEPHFALLREEVKFGRKQSKKIQAPEEIKFFLLHLSLLREYLEMEFSCLKETLPFNFNLENIIDDWVLMGFLVGNDFIPHLPGMHINNGALSVLYKAYCEILPTLDGYLNEGGKLNLERFEAYMKKLASFDIKQFREQYDDMRYLKSKTSNNGYIPRITKEEDIRFRNVLEPYFEDDEEVIEEELGGMKRCVKIMDDENKGTGSGGEDDSGDEYVDMDKAVHDMMDLDESDGSEYYDVDDKEADRLAFFQEFCLHKKNYYQEKLEYKKLTPEVLRGQAEGYIKALQWNLHYYYDGLCSWSWYYPHHYAPYMSDIQNFKDMEIEFEPGRPFLPFEQLLAVLPSFSKELLPKPFQELMTDETSPIFKYYPLDFRTDLNGKKNDWEAVVLIPFIDEERLLKSMEECYHRLTDEEKQRNKHGPMHVFTYSKEPLGRLESPAYFGAIEKNHALDTPLYREDILMPREKLRKGLLEGALVGVYFPGFPTFKNLQYTSALRQVGVKVFQSPSQGLNMIVQVGALDKEYTHQDVVERFFTKVVHVNWPYLTEALVIGIKSVSKETLLEAGVSRTTELDTKDKFASECRQVAQDLLKSRGIDVGTTDFLIKVRPLEGQKFTFSSTTSGADMKIHLEKKWSNSIRSVPLQVVIEDVQTKRLDPNVTLDDIFQMDRNCFLLNPKHYGCLGFVNGKSEDGCVKVRITVPPEPEFADINIHRSNLYYYSNNEAAQRAHISTHLLARITGTILVLDTNDPIMMDKAPKVNIGLNLKFSRRNQQLPGFTKRTENNQWLYSDKTIKLVQEYADEFPEVIKYLAKNADKDVIFKNDIFPLPGQAHMLNVISNWLDSRPELKAERRSCDAVILEPDQISELEYRVDQFMKMNKRGRFVNSKVKPFQLFLASSIVEKTAPDSNADFQLLDRVVNVRDNFIVPLGNRGTIIGLETPQDDSSTMQCDILFDQPFNAANQYYTKKKRVFRMPNLCLLNITYAKNKFAREEVSKRTAMNTQKMAETMLLPNNMRVITSEDARQPSSANRQYPTAIPVSSFMSHFAHHPVVAASGKATSTPNEAVQGRQKRLIVTSREVEAKNEVLHAKINGGVKKTEKNVAVTPKAEKKATATVEESKEPTNTLKKLLKISSSKEEAGTLPPPVQEVQMLTVAELERGNAPKDYIIELQDIFMKLGQPSPHYEYDHSNGSICATLFLPNIEIGVVGDPASSKKMAAERAAFLVLHFLGLVKNVGDRVAPTEVNERSLRELYKRIGLLKERLSDLHRKQVVASQQQQQPLPPPPPPVQPQQYAQTLPMMNAMPTLAQFPTLPQVSTVPMPQQPPAFNPNLIRPTPQFPPNAYAATVFQQRPVGLATNYLFQQQLISPQQQYYQQASFRPTTFSVNNPLSIPTSATFAVSTAGSVSVPQFGQQYVLNSTNGPPAATVAATNMPRVRLQSNVQQSQFAQSQMQRPSTTGTVFNSGVTSQANTRPASGFARGSVGAALIFSKAVGSSPVPRQQMVRPYLNERVPSALPTSLNREFESVTSSSHHFNPIQQDTMFITATATGHLSEASVATSSVNTTRTNQEDLSLFSSGRVSKTPRKNRLAANFATKPSV